MTSGRPVETTRAEVLDAIERLYKEEGEVSSRTIKDAPYCPTLNTVRRRVGGVRTARRIIGAENIWTKELIAQDLRAMSKELGRTPKQYEVAEDPIMPSIAEIQRHFDTYSEALYYSGLVPDKIKESYKKAREKYPM